MEEPITAVFLDLTNARCSYLRGCSCIETNLASIGTWNVSFYTIDVHNSGMFVRAYTYVTGWGFILPLPFVKSIYGVCRYAD